MSTFSDQYLAETLSILSALDKDEIERVAVQLNVARTLGGRLFVLGVGGSAGHATHAVNDFRKICRFETYTPTDNVCELTARINDDGWDSCFAAWLEGSHLNDKDIVLVLSVGGGNEEKNVSVNLVKALQYSQAVGAKIVGVVGKDGGFTKKVSAACVVIPPMFSDKITPHTEGICSVVLHLLASHPILKIDATKWESVR